MIAKIFPLEAKKSAFCGGIELCSAPRNATSEENGKIVAAKNAKKKSVSSAI